MLPRLHLVAALLQVLELQVAMEVHLAEEREDKATPLILLMHTMTQKLGFQQDSLARSLAKQDFLEVRLAAAEAAVEVVTLFGTTAEAPALTLEALAVMVAQGK